ncbi:histidine ammonia-lyase [Rhodonellum psychrophilum GCM71 = DSM 17998]|uniref:Histidine ammonia-lyase n=2 Tax=Rhodonellum TaxID=336827 RepID=U5C662_9BACT|nr:MULTISPECIES: histidine ammonia-lyase [Rhodonellum]ERM83702.1 histidine ammonia-lyase [Rhodonellum psychrophilum GCM71 = DSM 17998]SDY90209.1 histidine ammonia-lyase [Rhodonellum ikkaensis]
MPKTFQYGQDHLTCSIALGICRGNIQGTISDESREKVRKSAQAVDRIVEKGRPVYGINTGFGPLCTTMISPEQTRKLQENLLKSHAVGLGEAIPIEISKLMLVLKAHALAQGFSGIQESTLDRILWHIENNIIPVVPKQGSVGASGDLAPLSHLFLPLIGLGKVHYKGEIISTAKLFQQLDLAPIHLGPKEGLALINGTQFMAAFGVMIVYRFYNILAHADITGAMMLEGLLGSIKPFSTELHQLRPYAGNQHVAQSILNLLHDSEIVHSHAACARVQDPYSLRCMPQVHGASRNAWLHLKQMIEIEINSVTDNPVVFDENHTISGGNFHGQPIAMPLDYTCLAASEIGNISDRRIYLSLEGDTPGVPKLLLKETGLNSGFMIPQYTTAALASENKGLCFPSSADSIPTSLGQEDHVSMGSIGARKALQVIENVEKILGVELFCAAQAVDFHAPLKSGKIMTALYEHVRTKIKHVTEDQLMYEDMEIAIDIIRSGELLTLAKEVAAREGLKLETKWSEEFDRF